MGRIFKTPKDDSVEETLRAMHLANTFDNTYEWGVGWLRTIIFSTAAALGTSAFQHYTGEDVWALTVEWFAIKLGELGEWLIGLVPL